MQQGVLVIPTMQTLWWESTLLVRKPAFGRGWWCLSASSQHHWFTETDAFKEVRLPTWAFARSRTIWVYGRFRCKMLNWTFSDLDHPYIGQDDKCSIQRQWPTVPRLVERRHINTMTTLLSSESSELKNTSGAEAKARDDEELVRVQGQGQERSDIGPENLHHSDVQKHARKQWSYTHLAETTDRVLYNSQTADSDPKSWLWPNRVA